MGSSLDSVEGSIVEFSVGLIPNSTLEYTVDSTMVLKWFVQWVVPECTAEPVEDSALGPVAQAVQTSARCTISPGKSPLPTQLYSLM
eukprot:11182962-Lingulodinium_polyedra.AAC.1